MRARTTASSWSPAAILALLAAFRIAVYIGYKNSFVPPEDAGKWERLYGIGAISFMTAVGLTAALLFNERTDEITRLYAVVISIGCAGALAARNAACPIVVYGQVLGVCGPIALSLLIEHNPWFWGLAVMMVLIMVSVKSTTKSLNSVIVSALLNGREAENQREQLSTALDSMSHGPVHGRGQWRDQGGERAHARLLRPRLRDRGADHRQARPRHRHRHADERAGGGRLHRRLGGAACQRHPSTFTETVQDRIYDFRCEPRARGGFVLVVEDVTEARLAAREIEQMAHFDAVTGLPNRAHFHQQLEEALGPAPGPGRAAGPDEHRPRPLQGGQRHPRPPGRRRAVAAGGAAAAQQPARVGHGRPGSAATSSRCWCARPTTSTA
ncbi:MAG: hypothetical protein WDM92_10315 [Caulobacteraceae bacterium]